MAYRIEINKDVLTNALDMAIKSNTRAINSAKYPAMKPIMEQANTELQKALLSITECK